MLGCGEGSGTSRSQGDWEERMRIQGAKEGRHTEARGRTHCQWHWPIKLQAVRNTGQLPSGVEGDRRWVVWCDVGRHGQTKARSLGIE